jgi:2-polyprenyl-3-methyl-5-hydroxy-6-metoxy-1,4-benzoquinol methylase
MVIFDLNRSAWDHVVEEGENPYTNAVSPKEIAKAKQGDWSVYLSDRKPVPHTWFPELKGLKVLCLASGGGQQAPILAALGAEVSLLDASPKQLAQDEYVAKRENLNIRRKYTSDSAMP